jgi:pimeloyl-ACP methyl ester carboxylesterase
VTGPPRPDPRRLARAAAVAGAGLLATAGAAAASPTVRAEAHRLRSLGRPLDRAGGPPVPPPLPPGVSVAVPGRGELFVRDTGGRRPAVLLLHGWGATADVNFFRAYPALAGYRVLAVDHRSHGRGMRPHTPFTLEDCADDVAGLLGVLGVDRAVAVGYSMGGPIALLLAGRHADRVAGLVLGATALEFSSGVRDRALWRGLTVVESALRHGYGDGALQRMLRETVDKDPSLDRYRAWLAGEFRRGHAPGLVEAGHALSRFDARGFAAGLPQPVAVVVTTGDRLVPPRKQRALARALGAPTFDLACDHDAPLAGGDAFGDVLRAAADDVTARAAREGRRARRPPRAPGRRAISGRYHRHRG